MGYVRVVYTENGVRLDYPRFWTTPGLPSIQRTLKVMTPLE
jgi:hypothetical protein